MFLSNADVDNLRYAIVRRACEDYVDALHTKRRLERKWLFINMTGCKLVAIPRKIGGGRKG